MEVLVYGYPSETGLGQICATGFERAGHDVTYTPRESGPIPFFPSVLGPDNQARLRETARSLQPDLVFVVKGYDLDKEAVTALRRETDAAVVNWNPDNPFQVRSRPERAETYLDALPAYDVVFIWGEFLVDRLRAEGADRVEVLPFAHDPRFHYPADPRDEYDCEVAFLGHYSEKRQRTLTALTDFDFQLRGNLWRLRCWDRSLRRHHRGPAVTGAEYARAMASADIVVNVVADHNVPAHNMRTFEVPPTGSLMVTTDTGGQREFFDEDALVTYGNPGELREIVSYYLDAPEEREAMAGRAREQVQSHTYERRMERVIEAVRTN